MSNSKKQAVYDSVYNFLARRPKMGATREEIIDTTSLHPKTVSNCLGMLLEGGYIKKADVKRKSAKTNRSLTVYLALKDK